MFIDYEVLESQGLREILMKNESLCCFRKIGQVNLNSTAKDH